MKRGFEVDRTGRYYLNTCCGNISSQATGIVPTTQSHGDGVSANPDGKICVRQLHDFLKYSMTALSSGIKSISSRDMSVYTGAVGIAMTMSRLRWFLDSKSSRPSSRHFPALKSSKSDKEWNGIGFCSNGLCYELYACLCNNSAFNLDESIYTNREEYDEVLYGRSGLVLLLRYFACHGLILRDPDLPNKVMASIDLAEYPWSWHDKVYYGGAHGTAGILNTLKRCSNMHDRVGVVEDLVTQASIPSSGNFKSSMHSTKDDCVQWCHGAPGFIPLLLSYQSLSPIAATALPAALNCIWERGLLAKGCGICHGVAGNAYCFLAAYQATLDSRYLEQACVFAEHILALGVVNCCRNADRPLSLFEGLSGTVQFVMDLADIMERTDERSIKEYVLFDGLDIFGE